MWPWPILKVLAVIEKLLRLGMTTRNDRNRVVPCVALATPSSLRNPRRMFFHLFYCSFLPSFPPSFCPPFLSLSASRRDLTTCYAIFSAGLRQRSSPLLPPSLTPSLTLSGGHILRQRGIRHKKVGKECRMSHATCRLAGAT